MIPEFPEPKQIKVYTAILNQTGTENPVATVLHNTLGTIEWTRISVGLYYAVITDGFFTENKTITLANHATPALYIATGVETNDTCWVQQILGSNGSPVDEMFYEVIEIRVYQ